MSRDTELVGRARDGDSHAFGELVRHHQMTLYRTALAIVRSAADAEDVTQSAWLQAYWRLERFRGTASITTWLTAIVRNQAIDHQRTMRRRLRRDARQAQLDATGSACVSGGPSPEDLVLLNERRSHLARALEALRPRLRKALQLWHSGAYTYEEMAQIAGVATGTIKSRVREARRQVTGRLRVTLQESRPPDGGHYARSKSRLLVSRRPCA